MRNASEDRIKETVQNSLKYRVTNRITQEVQSSCLPNYLNEAIEQMYKENNTDRKGTIEDPFYIIKKSLKERTIVQQKCVANYLRTHYDKLSTFDTDQLLNINKKLIPELFLAGQMIVSTWKRQRVAIIIVQGHVDVILPSGTEYFTNAPVMFGGFWIDNSTEQTDVQLRC